MIDTPTLPSLTLTRPDDWHVHLRDGAALAAVLPHTAAQFARAIVMPNLRQPITTVSAALAYRQRILAALPEGLSFTPLMTLYLTDNTTPDEIRAAHASGVIHAVKLYPAGATTNSDAGVSDLARCAAVLAEMERLALPLLIHGEVTDPEVDLFDREPVFIEHVLQPLLQRYPGLRVVLEHITTQEAVDFVTQSNADIGATITAHHLRYNRNALFRGGVRPHYYCLPVLKRERHRLALLAAAVSGNPRFFLGTDSAPHARTAKEAACACAGCYTAHAALELYAEAFAAANALDRLEAFASFHGADFYRLPRNRERITLLQRAWTVPSVYPYVEGDTLIPLGAGEELSWQIAAR
ncbi:MAG: dihydroorotase [Pseudomonadota bacterium]